MRDLLSLAREFLQAHRGRGEIVVIAPVKYAADDLVRSACPEALAGVHRFTLEQFAASAATESLTRAGLATITRTVREALAARVADKARRAGKLQYFAPVARMRGFAPALTRTLLDLRMNGVDVHALHSAGCHDLAVLLELYQQELAEHRLADRATRFLHAAKGLSGNPVYLLLDVPSRYTLESELVDAVLASAAAGLRLVSGPSTGCVPETALASLQSQLFAERQVEPRPEDESFEIFSASGEALECVEIMRRVNKYAGRGIRFDEMAVLLRTPERHGALLAEAARRAGVEAYFSGAARRPDPSGRALLSLLHCAVENLSQRRFAEYLSLGQVPDHAGSTVGWERLLTRAAVHEGGEQRWCERLDSLGDAAEGLRRFALPLMKELAALRVGRTWGAWLEILEALSAHALRSPEPVYELLDELQPMAEIGPIDLQTVLLTLEDRLRFVRPTPTGERYGRIFVGSIDEARGMSFRVVFIPGLNEGTFPARIHEDPLLLDEKRRELCMPSEQDDADLFRTAVAAASDHLQLSYSRLDLVTGRARVPSFYVFEAYKAARGESPDVQGLQREARESAETRAGWPAPVRSEDAIDDVEYDLAELKAAFESNIPGAAAYLDGANAHVLRSLRARWRRWDPKWHGSDGLLKLEIDAHIHLEQFRPTRQPVSPSLLERYAFCPYAFVLKGIFGLKPLEQPSAPERMDPLVRGMIFHRTIADFVREGERDLDVVLDRVAEEYARELAPAITETWQADVERLRLDLRGWVHGRQQGWTPAFSEWSFGLEDVSGCDPASLPEPVLVLDRYLLQGSVDLIEQNAAGQLRVVDLKTGSVPKPRPECIGGGEALQPALYALAAEAGLHRSVVGGRLHYATLRQNYQAIDVPLQSARIRARDVLSAVDKAFEDGFFPAAPRKDACASCDYLSICGPYEEERVSRKPKEELRELRAIRKAR